MKNLLFFFALLMAGTVNAQTDEFPKPGRLVPPSPTAASLGIYGNFPVDYYVGTTGVTIPLYDIKTANLSLPINLKYFSSGLKVGEDASWVGNGWSLAAGGVITRTVRGLDDFDHPFSGGFYLSPAIPPKDELYGADRSPATIDFIENVFQGKWDSEADIFNYNFGTYTGKFMMGKSAEGAKIYMADRNALKPVYSFTNNSWTITDTEGIKYYFGTKEKSTDYTSVTIASEIRDDAPLAYFDSPVSQPMITSWYLDSIVSPNADKISFTYEQKAQSLSAISRSESSYDQLSTLYFDCPQGGTPSGNYKNFIASRQLIYDMVLKKITFGQGSVEFTTKDREDIEYQGTVKPQALSEILIKNSAGALQKKYTLYSSYFLASPHGGLTNDDYNRRRLKLDSVAEFDSNSAGRRSHKLDYFEPTNIPYKYSKAIDHWGFYNGVTANTGLLLEKTLLDYNIAFPGNDRRPDTSVANLKRGVLASITYPTGGRTDFDYELNEYRNPKGADAYNLVPLSATAHSRFDSDANITSSFDIVGDTVNVAFQGKFKKMNPDVSYIGDFAHVYKDGSLVMDFWETADPQPAGYSHDQTYTKILKPGHYVIDVRFIPGITMVITASWNAKVPVTTRKGGGLRIKSITNFDNGIQVAKKKLLYTMNDGTPSGLLIQKPLYDYQTIVKTFSAQPPFPGSPPGNCNIVARYLGRTSNTLTGPGLASGPGIIGYNQVTEQFDDAGVNGKTVYTFTNSEDSPTQASFPGLPQQHNAFNGKLTRSLTYKATGQVIKKLESEYASINPQYLLQAKLYRGAVPGDSYYGSAFMRIFNDVSSWVVTISDRSVSYSGTDSLVTVNNHYYDNQTHYSMTRDEVINSIGDTVTTLTNYPQDYNTGTAFITAMINANHVTKPIEIVKYLNRKAAGAPLILEGTIVTYKPDSKGLIDEVKTLPVVQPLALSTFKFSNRVLGALPSYTLRTNFLPDNKYEQKYQNNSYDAKGNVTERTITNGIKESYFWSASGRYLAATVIGSDYTTAKALISQPVLDNPASTDAQLRTELQKLRTGLIGAQVSTYSYKPLAGIASITDPKGMITFFEYDTFQRLMAIKDQNGNVVKSTEYHYKP